MALLALTAFLFACNGERKLQRSELPVEERYQQERGWLARKRRSRRRPPSEERRRHRPGDDRSRGSTQPDAPSNAPADHQRGPSEDTGEMLLETAGADKLPASKQAKRVIKTARSYLGTDYKWGGTSKRGIDCSGLMVVSFQSVGKDLPRVSNDQYQAGRHIKRKKVRPGDMIFFSYRKGARITHTGLVVEARRKGPIKFIHSSSSSGVIISSLDEDYWAKRFRGAARMLE